ncbi:hypothetical protein JG688_00017947 [Phytophthora aleatoria]|uniref:Uncharacterized protein n=1 Tax=Phytophthora aleatoria TaxID=2496075 RepID=A0A8J5IWM6_9STRA|nr:hypothetical protein JG688_00017947 [Phytophthora aleatoria]
MILRTVTRGLGRLRRRVLFVLRKPIQLNLLSTTTSIAQKTSRSSCCRLRAVMEASLVSPSTIRCVPVCFICTKDTDDR